MSTAIASHLTEIQRGWRDFEVRRLQVSGSAMTPNFDPERSNAMSPRWCASWLSCWKNDVEDILVGV